jgi:hypothetical protein
VHVCHAILSFLGIFWLSLGVHWQESNVILSTCDLDLSGGIGNVFDNQGWLLSDPVTLSAMINSSESFRS